MHAFAKEQSWQRKFACSCCFHSLGLAGFMLAHGWRLLSWRSHQADHPALSVSDCADSCTIGSATSGSSLTSCTVCNVGKPGIDGTGMRRAALLDLDGTELKVWLRCMAAFHASWVIPNISFCPSLTVSMYAA